MATNYIFKEITDRDELLRLFLFRYKVYSECELKVFLKENDPQIDLDHFDVHSRHFGLFSGNDLVGCLRVVFPKDEITNYDVLEIGKQYGLMDEVDYFNKNGKAPFPFLSYEAVPKSHWQFYNDITSRNERIAESSRFMLHPEHRSIRTSKYLCECAMMFFVIFFVGCKHALTSVRKEHSPFYIRQGFRLIANGDTYFLKETGITGITLTIPLAQSLAESTIPNQLHKKINQMAEEFTSTGKIEREL